MFTFSFTITYNTNITYTTDTSYNTNIIIYNTYITYNTYVTINITYNTIVTYTTIKNTTNTTILLTQLIIQIFYSNYTSSTYSFTKKKLDCYSKQGSILLENILS